MKRIKIFLILFISAVIIISCYWTPDFETGEFSINITKSISKAVGEYYARVYLLKGGNLIAIGDDTAYQQVPFQVTETIVTVQGIPAGSGYKVLLAIVTEQVGYNHEVYFKTEQYAESAAFDISAGVNEAVPVALEDSPFTTSDVMGQNIKGVVVDSSIYTVSAENIFTLSLTGILSDTSIMPSGHTANSVSQGIDISGSGAIWVNTDKGIVPFDGNNFNDVISAPLGDLSILESGGFQDVVPDPDNYLIFFQREGGLGGVYSSDPSSETAIWQDIDLSEFITGQPVMGFVVPDATGGYFATKLGAFKMKREIVDAGDDADLLSEEYTTFFTAGGDSNPIYAIDYADATYFLGTENGVYTSADPIAVVPDVITGTEGYSFRMVSALDSNYYAALSDIYLFVWKAGVLEKIPFHAGLPGTVTGMDWTASHNLIISGTQGLVIY